MWHAGRILAVRLESLKCSAPLWFSPRSEGVSQMFYLTEKVLAGLVIAKAGALRLRFEKESHSLRETQRRVLLGKIRRNEDSEFGKKWHFNEIRSVADFRRRLPVATYSQFEPYIERLKRGETRCLMGRAQKVLMFAITSGTLSAPKFIPVTEPFIEEYRRGWLIWGVYALEKHRDAFLGKIFQIVSSSSETLTPSGIPCGSISGLISEMQGKVVRQRYVVPPALNLLENNERKQYLLMRLALVSDITFLTTANPSTLIRLAGLADERKESLIRDIFDGTIEGRRKIEEPLQQSLRHLFRPDPERASLLEAIAKKKGHLYPSDYWPNLSLLGVWKGGPLHFYVERLGEFFGEVPVRDIGLLASEGRMTIPIDDAGSAGVLDFQSHFYEFIPEEEIENPRPVVLLPEEIEEGRNYYIILTTSSGLYRYNICDVVKMVGRFNDVPVVSFINKGAHISNITGEKISEYQVVSAMKEVCSKLGLCVEVFTFCLCFDEVPFYAVVAEADQVGSSGQQKQLLRGVEEVLCRMNVEYKGKRKSGRLAPLRLKLVEPGSFARYEKQEVSRRGGRYEQFKHRYLVSNEDFLDRFTLVAEVLQG